MVKTTEPYTRLLFLGSGDSYFKFFVQKDGFYEQDLVICVEIAQMVKWQTVESEAMGSIPSGE